MINIHKTFSDIERDMAAYYAGKLDALDLSLKIACRALTVAAELHGGGKVLESKQLVWDLLSERQLNEIESRLGALTPSLNPAAKHSGK